MKVFGTKKRFRSRWIGMLQGVFVLLLTIWGGLALWYQLPGQSAACLLPLWSLVGALTLWLTARPNTGRAGRLAVVPVAMVALLMAWWQTLTPSHQRVWADDVARLLESEIDGERITLHNVRNFDWQSETVYTPRWETRSYDLNRLQSADLILSYWMGPHIAHTLVSFRFDDGQRLVFSLEIRKEKHENFSAIGGFFRKFEQVIIAADEHDIVKTRSNARGEEVYLYRLGLNREHLRAAFLGYLERAESLRRAPQFYNTLTSNCTTIIFELARHLEPGLPVDYRLLLSGHFAEYAYEQGALTQGYDYARLRALGRINDRAMRADDYDSAGFSQAIRTGVPGMLVDGSH